jgi:diguanylate cyclase (GGDEF)-like protein
MTEPTPCPRILVVEDDPDQLALICDALSAQYGPGGDRRIVGVRTGTECLAEDLAGFDVVLLDYHLPDVEGLDVLRQILARADVPVLFVTGENDSTVAAEAVRCGAQDYIVKLGDYLFALPVVIEKSIRQHEMQRENEHLQQQLQLMLDKLQVKNLQLEEALQKQREMAATDHLTGLANRRRFRDVLERHFREAVRYGFDLTCCMCDLDGFKQLNDALGHQFGDRVLVAAAAALRATVRESDLAARYGGDEFVLLLPHTGCRKALTVCERLREKLAVEVARFDGLARSQRLSIGVASLQTDHPATADALVSMADRAMYAAKKVGTSGAVLFARAKALAPAV